MPDMKHMDMSGSNEWITLLKKETSKPDSSIAKVAGKLGVARPTLSRIISGTYDANTDKIAEKVLRMFGHEVFCPFLQRGISKQRCDRTRSTEPVTIDPYFFEHHLACQSCPVNVSDDLNSDAANTKSSGVVKS